MEYSKLVAVTGLPGLFELLSSKSDGGVVRSLEDNSTKFVSSRVHNFSHLESIEVRAVGHVVVGVDHARHHVARLEIHELVRPGAHRLHVDLAGLALLEQVGRVLGRLDARPGESEVGDEGDVGLLQAEAHRHVVDLVDAVDQRLGCGRQCVAKPKK